MIRSVYDKYKKYCSYGIPAPENYKSVIDEDDQNILIEVYDVFGKYSAWGLRNMTHQEDPWKNAKTSEIISKENIKHYFKEHYIENGQN